MSVAPLRATAVAFNVNAGPILPPPAANSIWMNGGRNSIAASTVADNLALNTSPAFAVCANWEKTDSSAKLANGAGGLTADIADSALTSTIWINDTISDSNSALNTIGIFPENSGSDGTVNGILASVSGLSSGNLSLQPM